MLFFGYRNQGEDCTSCQQAHGWEISSSLDQTPGKYLIFEKEVARNSNFLPATYKNKILNFRAERNVKSQPVQYLSLALED